MDEAAFFLEKVREHYFTVLDNDAPGSPLIYYVSAFISAARSVSWVMRSEYGRSKGWETWYRSKELGVEDLALLARFTKIRNRSEHADPLRIAIRLYASLAGEASPNDEGRRASKNARLQQYRITITEVDPPSGEPRSVEAVLDTIECGLPELGEDDLLDAAAAILNS